jgi:hypothetical protein
MTASPLGKYSQMVAAIVAIGVIGVDVGLRVAGVTPDGFMDNLAFAAFGAIFGASATTALTNGTVGRDLAALHARLDSLGVPASSGDELP